MPDINCLLVFVVELICNLGMTVVIFTYPQWEPDCFIFVHVTKAVRIYTVVQKKLSVYFLVPSSEQP